MAIRPNIADFESDVDYLVACECYGLELEYELEARMAEEQAELEDSEKESNNSSIKTILKEFQNYWDCTYEGADFKSYTDGGLKCDVVEINDTNLLVVFNKKDLYDFEILLTNLINDYDLSNELSLEVTKDYDKLLFEYERAILIQDVTE